MSAVRFAAQQVLKSGRVAAEWCLVKNLPSDIFSGLVVYFFLFIQRKISLTINSH